MEEYIQEWKHKLPPPAQHVPDLVHHHLTEEYLGKYNTCEDGFFFMFDYLMMRTHARLCESHWTSFTEEDWKKIVLAEPWEWKPTDWKHALESDTSEQLVSLPTDQGTPTNQFLCLKCGQRKCVFSTAQTRSADEGMTTFVTCLNCGKNWKM